MGEAERELTPPRRDQIAVSFPPSSPSLGRKQESVASRHRATSDFSERNAVKKQEYNLE